VALGFVRVSQDVGAGGLNVFAVWAGPANRSPSNMVCGGLDVHGGSVVTEIIKTFSIQFSRRFYQ